MPRRPARQLALPEPGQAGGWPPSWQGPYGTADGLRWAAEGDHHGASYEIVVLADAAGEGGIIATARWGARYAAEAAGWPDVDAAQHWAVAQVAGWAFGHRQEHDNR
jgi:hypothetical protein